MATARSHSRRVDSAPAGPPLFSGLLLLMLGGSQSLQGVVAVFRADRYLTGADGTVFEADYRVWGWTYLSIGLVAVVTGVGVLLGRGWARLLGVVVAVISAQVSVAVLVAYPLWGAIVIAVDVLAVYALTVGRRAGVC